MHMWPAVTDGDDGPTAPSRYDLFHDDTVEILGVVTNDIVCGVSEVRRASERSLDTAGCEYHGTRSLGRGVGDRMNRDAVAKQCRDVGCSECPDLTPGRRW